MFLQEASSMSLDYNESTNFTDQIQGLDRAKWMLQHDICSQ